ncbi:MULTISPECIES: glycine cleavage system protein GcvH [Paenibacillus]|uniref:Glycine cleavage system H protein n=3 Tax=Paenibacillus TaxID=44249 RepID=A0A081NSX4_9BACL|nr:MULTISPECIES: glycine cleavage system protein GcvH [Paenibacillus]GMX60717.1 glycine cleavage system protein GcvH [Paenibacillus elgii]KEQ21547.1 glycine cleavage system protein H [Paenibacillus tyrfis]KPV60372.1 glycine cleavage system protein H [Paenibacillus sp. A3]MBU7320641.1 glycine cleavage system protein GcvH [Paenibacillus oleatilyticus]MCP1307724.1 glycine cleavage system protein GcvH [Paenibacillus tyrfis]
MEVIKGLKYSENHEWVRVENGRAVIGLTDFAQEEFGIIVFVELPEEGDVLQAGEPFGSMESVKTVTELYAPVSGKVVSVNPKLTENPGVINLSPYGQGWMIVVEMSDPAELDRLWEADKYEQTYVHE